jgi:hypothetical protein
MIGTARTRSGKKRDHRQDEPEQHGAGVTHEDPRGIDVVAQEPERCAEHDGRQDRGLDLRPRQRERDKREGEGRDRRHARGEAVEPVEEVDHVHDRDDPEDREGHPDPVRQRVDAEDREREAVHPNPEAHRYRCGCDLAAELLPPPQSAEVVDRTDGRRNGCAE